MYSIWQHRKRRVNDEVQVCRIYPVTDIGSCELYARIIAIL